MDKALAQIPGISYDFTQPMAMRLDETVSGVKADLAVKVFGDDFQQLDSLAQQVLRQVNAVRGAADAQMEINSGVAELIVKIRRDALARYGLNVLDVQQAVEAGASGAVVSQVIDGQRRYNHSAAPARSVSLRLRLDAGDPIACSGRSYGDAGSGCGRRCDARS
jgi:cobalt-zinc-cadmium resistance protein CzcA